MAFHRPQPIAQAEPSPVAPGIRAREWRWLAVVGVLLLLITLLPILVAVRQTPPGAPHLPLALALICGVFTVALRLRRDPAPRLIDREGQWAFFQVIP